MTPGQLLDAIRGHYLERLLAAAAERAQGGADVILEAVLRDAKGAAAREGALDTAMRVDLVAIGPGGHVENVSITTETIRPHRSGGRPVDRWTASSAARPCARGHRRPCARGHR